MVQPVKPDHSSGCDFSIRPSEWRYDASDLAGYTGEVVMDGVNQGIAHSAEESDEVARRLGRNFGRLGGGFGVVVGAESDQRDGMDATGAYVVNGAGAAAGSTVASVTTRFLTARAVTTFIPVVAGPAVAPVVATVAAVGIGWAATNVARDWWNNNAT